MMHQDPIEGWPEEEHSKKAKPAREECDGSTPGILKKVWKKVTTLRHSRKTLLCNEGSQAPIGPCISLHPSEEI